MRATQATTDLRAVEGSVASDTPQANGAEYLRPDVSQPPLNRGFIHENRASQPIDMTAKMPATEPPSADEARDSTNDVFALMRDCTRRSTNRIAIHQDRGDEEFELTYGELWHRAVQLSKAIRGLGLGPHDPVAILAESGPEWGLVLLAALGARTPLVPLDPSMTEAELLTFLSHAQPRLLFASARLAETAGRLQRSSSSIAHLAIMDATWLASLELEGQPNTLPERHADDDLALIIYTASTPDNPKGVMISHGNLAFQLRRTGRLIGLRPGDRALSILPMHHLFELTVGYLGFLHAGGTIFYSPSFHPEEVVEKLRRHRITTLIGVPLFFSAFKAGIERQLDGAPPWIRRWFRMALKLAPLLPSDAMRRILFRPLHRQLGGALRSFGSGGAPLNRPLEEFFKALGTPILQGYGLTETSPVIASNAFNAHRVASVGRPLPGVEIRIERKPDEPDGEILTRGPHVMRGYFKRDDLTRAVIDSDGWFDTGDLGYLDQDGFLYITGRKKNIIVLGSGKIVHSY